MEIKKYTLEIPLTDLGFPDDHVFRETYKQDWTQERMEQLLEQRLKNTETQLWLLQHTRIHIAAFTEQEELMIELYKRGYKIINMSNGGVILEKKLQPIDQEAMYEHHFKHGHLYAYD